MKTYWARFARIGWFLVLSFPGLAQDGPSLNGSYAFLATAKQSDSLGETGGMLLSVINFDGAGNVSGTAVIKERTGRQEDGGTGTSSVRGTYATNPDGSGNVALEFTDFQFSVKLAMVIADGGKSIQFTDGPGNSGTLSLNVTLQGTPDKVTGTVPEGFFLQGFRPGAQATGLLPLTLNRTYNDRIAVYSTAAPVTGSGPLRCPDGSSDTWSATLPSVTVIMADTSGNFMMPVLIKGCGGDDRTNYTGLANINPAPNGISLVLHLTGYYIAGNARGTNGSAPQGAYGVQAIGEPFPNAALLQVWKFDGSGGIKTTSISAGGTTTFSGTYTTNPDGSGTINLTNDANASAAPLTFAYATADDAATIYFLRTSGGGLGANVVGGTGRRQ